MEFRKLRPEEIDIRVGSVFADKGVTLLLYKDARADMNILDETVGVENWQREHYEVKGNMFCKVGIFVGLLNCWVWKSDCGTESNTEKEKGESSDSFKRACVNWGIGRELYTAPFIYVPLDESFFEDKNGKRVLTSKAQKAINSARVHKIGYSEDGSIDELVIVDKDGTVVWRTR